jgi:peptidyl-tRNA hydrolase, PTH2 family
MKEIKQVIIIRNDIEMGKGKAVAQGAHAAIQSYDRAREDVPRLVSDWKMMGEKKICLKCDLQEILRVYEQARKAKLPCSIIKDAGHTQLEPGTITAVAIGPAEEDVIDKITKNLKLL